MINQNKLFSIPGGIALLACLLAGCTNVPASADQADRQKASVSAVKALLPDLQVGMTAELIRQQLGDPAEIRPMESTVGKAEVWVYNIERVVDTTQVVTGTVNIPAFALNTTGALNYIPEPVYSMADKKADITLSLLLIDGKLVAQNSVAREHLEYK